jgi:hypothetical protein
VSPRRGYRPSRYSRGHGSGYGGRYGRRTRRRLGRNEMPLLLITDAQPVAWLALVIVCRAVGRFLRRYRSELAPLWAGLGVWWTGIRLHDATGGTRANVLRWLTTALVVAVLVLVAELAPTTVGHAVRRAVAVLARVVVRSLGRLLVRAVGPVLRPVLGPVLGPVAARVRAGGVRGPWRTGDTTCG